MYLFLLGLLAGILLMVLIRGFTSGYEPSSIFASAGTTEEVQRIYDEEISRLTSEVNKSIGDAPTPEVAEKAAADLRDKIANLSGEATKAFAKVAPAPKQVTESSAPAPGPAPEAQVQTAPQTSTYEVEPY
jgi:hypothetical protein